MNFQGSNRPPGIRTNEQIKSDLMILPMNGQQKPKPNPANGQPRVTKDLLEGL
jgi:hypothetical protein